jgi:hypothetical protein
LARAKRTERTDARRRHRAQQAAELDEPQDGEELDEPEDTGPAAPARRRGASRASSSSAASRPAPRPARPSFFASARLAYRPANIREDLPYLPRLLIHWSVLLSAALAIAGTALYVPAVLDASAQSSGSTTTSANIGTLGYVGGTLFQLFASPPPFGAALLIGFMLPRATYLVGLVFGALASLLVSIYAVVLASHLGFGDAVIPYVVQAWVVGVLGTMFFSAGIAWYKRFLDLLNPNRGQRSKQQKPQQGRGNAPRNRLSGSNR